MEPLPEQASAGSVARLKPERLLKQTILHISPTDLEFVMVLSSSSRYLHASRALEIPFPTAFVPRVLSYSEGDEYERTLGTKLPLSKFPF